ncbi:MAG: hypothetical protein LBQ11_02430 [Candidatus Nomurabacteria bacterium]|nr:hypothetical protein [Candidatus Nomurabacteria bacterium]
MDPNQPDSSFGGPTDVPTPEVTPTPELEPEQPITPEPTPELFEQPVLTEEPTISTFETESLSPVDDNQPTVSVEEPVAAPVMTVPETTPEPATAFSAQPIVSEPMSAPNLPTDQPKSKKGLIIGLAAGIGGLIIIGVVLVLVLFVFGGDTIKTPEQLAQAIKDKKAINCVITKDGETGTIQSNNGWSKLRMKAPAGLGGGEMNVLAIEGDAMYVWSEGDSNGYKTKYDKTTIDRTTSGIDNDVKLKDTVKLNCEPSSQADYSVPSNIKFIEM